MESALNTLSLEEIASTRLPLVDVKRKRYLTRYTYEIIKGLTRSHSPKFTHKIKSTKYYVKPSDKDMKRWSEFVGIKDEHIEAPVSFYNGAGAFALFDILGQLKINFSTILHLKAELGVSGSLLENFTNRTVSLEMQLVDIVLRKKQCILVVETAVRDYSGRIIRTHKDFWFVKKCNPEFLKEVAYPLIHDEDELKGLSRRASQFVNLDNGNVLTRNFQVSKNAGHEYAKVSGDYNVIHTTHWGAKLCGQKRPFLQGFGIMSICMNELTQLRNKSLTGFSITFCRPTLVDQEVRLYLVGDEFELCDLEGRLLAFGKCS